MVGQTNHDLYRKRGFYYFCRRVPKALLAHYPKPRIVVALKAWMKSIIGGGNYVLHGLLHSLRDRLRAVECPSDIIDQIGGWATTGIGHAYGKGYGVEILAKWMTKIVAKKDSCL